MFKTLLFEKNEAVARVTFNRPDVLNALNVEMATELASLTRTIAMDSSVKVVILTGSGKAFSAGGDLKYFLNHERGIPSALHETAGQLHAAVSEIRRMPKAVIAMVNGIAAGAGFSLALACDFRYLAQSAKLKQAYTSAGLCLDGGSTFTLPRLVGLSRALEMAAFDPLLSAEEAHKFGLANGIFDDGKLASSVNEIALGLAEKSAHAIGQAKLLFNDSFDSSLEYQMEKERRAIETCGGHSDGVAGIQAFVKREKPVFL